MKILYYIIKKQTVKTGNVGVFTGWKSIQVYEIVNNVPKMFCDIEAMIDRSNENEIQVWLDQNGYEDKEFEFVPL